MTGKSSNQLLSRRSLTRICLPGRMSSQSATSETLGMHDPSRLRGQQKGKIRIDLLLQAAGLLNKSLGFAGVFESQAFF